MTIDALGGAAGLMARLPDVERAVAEAAERAQGTLDRILDRVDPVADDLDSLQATAKRLDNHLGIVEMHLTRLEDLVEPLEERFRELTAAANRLDGDLTHVLDRVPGLSAEDARDLAERPR
jgi:chromosome segregation ATPase